MKCQILSAMLLWVGCASASPIYLYHINNIGPGGAELALDTCGAASEIGECFGGGENVHSFNASKQTDGVDLTISAGATMPDTGKPTLTNLVLNTATNADAMYSIITATYKFQATLDYESTQAVSICGICPGLFKIPLIKLDVKDHGNVVFGPSIQFEKTAIWEYSRSIDVLGADYDFGPNFFDVGYDGNPHPAGTKEIGPEIGQVFFAPFSGLGFTRFAPSVIVTVQLNTDLQTNSAGGSPVGADFTSTTSIEGMSFYDDQGNDVTSAFKFQLDDGTPLFTSATTPATTPEPSPAWLIGLGLLGFVIQGTGCVRKVMSPGNPKSIFGVVRPGGDFWMAPIKTFNQKV